MKQFVCLVAGIGLFLFSYLDVAQAESSAATAVKSNKKDDPKTALVRYVAKPDDSFRWTKRSEGKIGVTAYTELKLTSQKWRDITWKHQLFILRPKSATADTKHALLFISGGRWRDKYDQPPEKGARMPREAAMFALIAERLKTPVAVLLQVPHQPIFDGKYEDAIIAYTFEKFIRTGDTEWPLLLPMVKSAVRGMDTVQQFAKKEWSMNIETFTITGASKRGWTTWLTGAVDKRAVALAPMVIDTLNMAPQMQHQLTAWGAYSNQIHDYTERGIQKHLRTSAGAALRTIVDPFSYRKILKQPKLIMIGTNDRYWPLDALDLYWNDLVGDNYILYIPNNRHGLKDFVRIIGSLNALHQSVANGKRLPKLTWELKRADSKLKLSVQSDLRPSRVRAWIATSKTRDFREAHWESVPAKANGKGFVYDLAIPKKGFAAMFGEVIYDEADGKLPYFFSTNVKIVSATEKVGK